MEEHKRIFAEFMEEALGSESRGRYNPAVSNYYKALTTLCSHLILSRLKKTPQNHSEIFLFLRTSFPEIYQIVNEVFTVYTSSYDHMMKEKDCRRIKDAIKETAKISGIEKEFKETIEKI